jgi:hypothetical protein
MSKVILHLRELLTATSFFEQMNSFSSNRDGAKLVFALEGNH